MACCPINTTPIGERRRRRERKIIRSRPRCLQVLREPRVRCCCCCCNAPAPKLGRRPISNRGWRLNGIGIVADSSCVCSFVSAPLVLRLALNIFPLAVSPAGKGAWRTKELERLSEGPAQRGTLRYGEEGRRDDPDRQAHGASAFGGVEEEDGQGLWPQAWSQPRQYRLASSGIERLC